MIVGDITSVIPTQNTSGKIICKVSKIGELDISYLSVLRHAVIIIGHTSVKLQQISGSPLNFLHGPRHTHTYNTAKSLQRHGEGHIIDFKRDSRLIGCVSKCEALNKSFGEHSVLRTLILHIRSQTNPLNQ